MLALNSKGLRRIGLLAHGLDVDPLNACPEFEGIKTASFSPVSEQSPLNACPEFEGIKTGGLLGGARATL